MSRVFWEGIGGAVGAVLRYTISGYVQGRVKGHGFPYGTLVVNVIGCLLIGVGSQVIAASDHLPSEVTLFVLVGTLGAFTTFSTLSKDTVDLFQSGRLSAALIDMGVHVVLGLAAVGGGYELGRFLQRWHT